MKYIPYIFAAIAGVITWIIYRKETTLKKEIAKHKYKLSRNKVKDIEQELELQRKKYEKAANKYRTMHGDYRSRSGKKDD